jgi:hypothetical protein
MTTTSDKFKDFFASSLTDVCCNWRGPVDESEMIRTEMRMHGRSENGRSVSGALYDSSP